MTLADGQLDRLIASLDASFDAAVARAEREAADDLALSLGHSGSFVEAASRLGALEVRIMGGVRAPVRVVGADYVASGDPLTLVVPAGRAVLVETDGRRPGVDLSDGLVPLLLRWSRTTPEVEVATDDGTLRGRLRTAGSDHLRIDVATTRWLLGLQTIRYVRRVARG
jgi:hypothetical protein